LRYNTLNGSQNWQKYAHKIYMWPFGFAGITMLYCRILGALLHLGLVRWWHSMWVSDSCSHACCVCRPLNLRVDYSVVVLMK